MGARFQGEGSEPRSPLPANPPLATPPPRGVTPSYLEASIAGVPPESSEAVTNFFWDIGALGVVEDEIPGEAPRVRAFFGGGVEAEHLRARVDRYLESLRALGLPPGGPARVSPVADQDWAVAWRRYFRPLAVGRSFVVAPPWETPAAGGRVVLTIEPGRAFGTGQHGSTAGCLRLLEDVVERARPARAIDVGTGSGILAIAAARLGVADVLAFDTDPDAVANAVANVARNGVADRVRCRVADVATLRAETAPLVVANLLSAAHCRLGPRYRASVAPGGTLLLGGVLDAEADRVVETLAPHGFAAARALSVEGWTSLELSHATLHDRA